MPFYQPETSPRKKIEALERHKAIADALIRFIKAHPDMTAEATLIELHGKVGPRFKESIEELTKHICSERRRLH